MGDWNLLQRWWDASFLAKIAQIVTTKRGRLYGLLVKSDRGCPVTDFGRSGSNGASLGIYMGID
jgi:hypothetical protein